MRVMQPELPLTAETRRAAAAPSEARDTQRAHVLDAIRAAGPSGLTDEEIQTTLGLDGSSERPRRYELWKAGRIRVRVDATGQTITRLTRTHRRAVVWIAEV